MDINAINAERAKLGKAPIQGGAAATPTQAQDPILARAQAIRDSTFSGNANYRAAQTRSKLSAIPKEYMDRFTGTTERLQDAQTRGMGKVEAGARAAVAGAGAVGGAVGSAISAFVPDTIEEKLGNAVSGAIPEGVKNWYKGLDKNNQALVMDLIDATNVVPVAGAGPIARAGASAAKSVKKMLPNIVDAVGATALTSDAINALRRKGQTMITKAGATEVDEIANLLRPDSLMEAGGTAGKAFRGTGEVTKPSLFGEITGLGSYGVKITAEEKKMASAVRNALPDVDLTDIVTLPRNIRSAVSELEGQVKQITNQSGPMGLANKAINTNTIISKLGSVASDIKSQSSLLTNVAPTVDRVLLQAQEFVVGAKTVDDALNGLRKFNQLVEPQMKDIADAVAKGAVKPLEFTALEQAVKGIRSAMREAVIEVASKINPSAARGMDTLIKQQHELLTAATRAEQVLSETVRKSQRTPLTKVQDRITDLYNKGGDIGLAFAAYGLLDFFGLNPLPEDFQTAIASLFAGALTVKLGKQTLARADVQKMFGDILIKHADTMTEMQRNGVVKTIEALAKVEAGIELDEATIKEIVGPSISEYVPKEELPVIEMGPKAPKTQNGLPVINADDATAPSAQQMPEAPAPEYEPYAKELPTIEMGSGKVAPTPEDTSVPSVQVDQLTTPSLTNAERAAKLPFRHKPETIDARLSVVLDGDITERSLKALDRMDAIIKRGLEIDNQLWLPVSKKLERARKKIEKELNQ